MPFYYKTLNTEANNVQISDPQCAQHKLGAILDTDKGLLGQPNHQPGAFHKIIFHHTSAAF